jgi:hypothetical protein
MLKHRIPNASRTIGRFDTSRSVWSARGSPPLSIQRESVICGSIPYCWHFQLSIYPKIHPSIPILFLGNITWDLRMAIYDLRMPPEVHISKTSFVIFVSFCKRSFVPFVLLRLKIRVQL